MPIVIRGRDDAPFDGDESGLAEWVDRAPEWKSRRLTDDEVWRLRSLLMDMLRRSGFGATHLAQVLFPGRDLKTSRVLVHRALAEFDREGGVGLFDLVEGG